MAIRYERPTKRTPARKKEVTNKMKFDEEKFNKAVQKVLNSGKLMGRRKIAKQSPRTEYVNQIISNLRGLSNEYKATILDLCKNKMIETTELMKKLKLNPRLFYHYLNQLEENAFIKRKKIKTQRGKKTFVQSYMNFEEAFASVKALFDLALEEIVKQRKKEGNKKEDEK